MKKIILFCINYYQKHHGFKNGLTRALFLTEDSCRFVPTCSQYTYEAVEKYGILGGLLRGFLRILRCHPFGRGGYDPLK
jgi:putative membrane protein insertion efficiency factor